MKNKTFYGMSMSANKQKYSYLFICLFVHSFNPLKLPCNRKNENQTKHFSVTIYLLNSVLLHHIVILLAIDIILKSN